MKQVKKTLDKLLLAANAFLITAMTLLSIWQVIARYFLDAPSTTSEEIIRFMLIWFTLLTATYVLGQQQHIAITFIKEKLNAGWQKGLNRFVNILWIVFGVGVMIAGGSWLLSYTYTEVAPATGLSMLFVYSALPVSGLFMTIYAVTHMVTPETYSENREETGQ
ncbi:TRAP-type C4-dicarboxylate transport system permease small subunit [Sinobaca qinghaiensis]|uniref:TRAP-type C4-dicarboxylate transport system permease small subunit n=1 Tax=Sinobaca qinghaiensis TaxID=342944 RepID=A0A419V8J7_9BACL|nr:TRAP transporter small permease [Sinobaca qinghaiensis]RKD76382.1 TRAP-type C4-dicarboxylate transport system permease small subunit [Sinobaca qinghaiensis]